MSIVKKIKIVSVLILFIVVGYVIFNQLFYEAPTPPVVIEPEDSEQIPEEPTKPEPEVFEGLAIEKIPYVDISNEVKLIHDLNQALSNPLSIYQWEELTLPVYLKTDYSFAQLNEKVMDIYQRIDIEKDELTCSPLNQDGWKAVVCEFDQGYIEVVQDGSYYVILNNELEVQLESYETLDIEKAINESWIKNMIEWDDYEIIIEMIHYDTFDQEIVDVSLVETSDEKFREKISLSFSYEHSTIVGISKTPDRVEKIMDVDILPMEDVDKMIESNNFSSILVDESNLNEIEIVGYELIYNYLSYANAIVPTIHVITTSSMDSYVDCFEAEGIVIHPLQMIATDEKNIRIE